MRPNEVSQSLQSIRDCSKTIVKELLRAKKASASPATQRLFNKAWVDYESARGHALKAFASLEIEMQEQEIQGGINNEQQQNQQQRSNVRFQEEVN